MIKASIARSLTAMVFALLLIGCIEGNAAPAFAVTSSEYYQMQRLARRGPVSPPPRPPQRPPTPPVPPPGMFEQSPPPPSVELPDRLPPSTTPPPISEPDKQPPEGVMLLDQSTDEHVEEIENAVEAESEEEGRVISGWIVAGGILLISLVALLSTIGIRKVRAHKDKAAKVVILEEVPQTEQPAQPEPKQSTQQAEQDNLCNNCKTATIGGQLYCYKCGEKTS